MHSWETIMQIWMWKLAHPSTIMECMCWEWNSCWRSSHTSQTVLIWLLTSHMGGPNLSTEFSLAAYCYPKEGPMKTRYEIIWPLQDFLLPFPVVPRSFYVMQQLTQPMQHKARAILWLWGLSAIYWSQSHIVMKQSSAFYCRAKPYKRLK